MPNHGYALFINHCLHTVVGHVHTLFFIVVVEPSQPLPVLLLPPLLCVKVQVASFKFPSFLETETQCHAFYR